MTVSYYSVADKYVDIIRKWYYDQYFVKISKRHAVLYSIGMVEDMPMSLVQQVHRLKFRFMHTRSVQIEEYHKRAIDKVSKLIYRHTYINYPTAVTSIVIAFALNCKLKRHTMQVHGVPKFKNKIDDMIDLETAKAL